jgi:hypothetical protein
MGEEKVIHASPESELLACSWLSTRYSLVSFGRMIRGRGTNVGSRPKTRCAVANRKRGGGRGRTPLQTSRSPAYDLHCIRGDRLRHRRIGHCFTASYSGARVHRCCPARWRCAARSVAAVGRSARAEGARIRAQVQESARLNHEIRNGLEVIGQAGYLLNDVVYGRAIADSVERIRKSLDESK